MADLLIHTGRFNADTQQPIMERWHDNGDGTYSQVVDIGASVTLSGALTVADGADVTQGAKADALATDTTSPWSVLALLKGLLSVLGFSGDATVAAGAVGSLSAKLRRVTQGIEDLKTLIIAGGKYNSGGVTLADGQRGDLQLDINAFLKATLGTLFYGEDSINNLLRTEEHWSWAYITSATNTVVKSGAGVFGVMIVVGGTAGTITAFDNTAASGTTIFAMDSTNAIAAYPFKAAFATGLTITTGAATKVFIGYR